METVENPRREAALRALQRLQDDDFDSATACLVTGGRLGVAPRTVWVEWEDDNGRIQKMSATQNPETGEWAKPWEITSCR